MLTIEGICRTIPDTPLSNRDVHGFYRDSIKALYGVSIGDAPPRVPTRSHAILTDLLSRSVQCNLEKSAKIKYFFDIRCMEDLGGVSPQYEILSALNLNHVQPLCIRGNGVTAIEEGLTLADAQLQSGECALFAFSRLRSAEWQQVSDEFAITFIVTSDGIDDGNLMIRRT